MVANPHTPAVITHGIVDALLPRVALRFHGVTSQSAGGGGAVARAHEDRVGSVTEMVCTSILRAWLARV